MYLVYDEFVVQSPLRWKVPLKMIRLDIREVLYLASRYDDPLSEVPGTRGCVQLLLEERDTRQPTSFILSSPSPDYAGVPTIVTPP